MKTVIISFLSLFILIPLSAQTWTTFTNHKNVTDIVKEESTLWVGTNGGLLKWDLTTETHEKYTTSDGLISNRIRQIILDNEGAIWIATERGVSVLNTNGEIINYTTEDGLLYNNISSVVIDSEGNKWFGTKVSYETNGLMKLDTEGNWTIFNPEEFLYNTRLEHLAIDADDNIWIATHAGVLRFNNDETWTVITTHSQTEPSIYAEIALDNNGEFWGVNNYGGLTHYDFAGNPTFFDESDGVPHYTLSIFIDEDNVKWFSTTEGLSKMNIDNQITSYPFDKEINSIYVENGKIWSGTSDDIDTFNQGEWESLISEDGFIANEVRDVDIAEDGTVLFASQRGIAEYSTNNEWQTYTDESGIFCDNTYRILATTDNRLLISHLYNCFPLYGISEINLETGEGSFIENDTFGLTYSMHEDLSGNIWLGYFTQPAFGPNVLKITPDGMIIPIDFAEVLANDQPNNKTLDIQEDANGTLYFSTRGGGVAITAAGEMSIFYEANCTSSFTDSQGNIWIGHGDFWSPGHKLFKKDVSGELIEYEIAGLSTAYKHQILEDMQNNIWFATDNGLYKRRPDDEFIHYSTADGLADDIITGIELTPEGVIWISTQNGVSSSADFPSLIINPEYGNEQLHIYPNPSTGVFNIEIPEEIEYQKPEITVFNSLGQLISLRSVLEQGILSVDLHGEAAGIYFAHLRLADTIYTAKLIMN